MKRIAIPDRYNLVDHFLQRHVREGRAALRFGKPPSWAPEPWGVASLCALRIQQSLCA
jgi:hypothetical protein